MVENICVGCLLLLGSISDIKTRKISVRLLLTFGILAVLYGIILRKYDSFLIGAIPGIAMILLAKVSRESVGYGDAYLLAVIGIFLGIKRTVAIIAIALFITSLYSISLFFRKKANLKKELPFIPALFAAFLLQI